MNAAVADTIRRKLRLGVERSGWDRLELSWYIELLNEVLSRLRHSVGRDLENAVGLDR